MFKRYFIILLALAMFSSGCTTIINGNGSERVVGSGKVISEDRPVSSFTQVSVNTSGVAEISLGETDSLKIEADDNILPYLTTEVVNGKLNINTKPNTSITTNTIIRYTITMKSVTMLETNGSADLNVAPVQADTLTLHSSGSGGITLASVTARSLTTILDGSGKCNLLAGKVDDLTVSVMGSGSVDSTAVEAKAVKATTTGSGNIKVWAKDTLNASSQGSGSVMYYGSPAVTQKTTGSGSVSGLGAK